MTDPTGTVRFGIIGCGDIAYWAHLRSLKSLKQANLVAVADPDAAARERARRLTGAEAYDDSSRLLRRVDVEAVIISAPTHLHAPLAIASARAGKHVYIEKPIATTLEDASRVAAAVERAGVRAVMGFNRRFHPLYRQARTLLADAAIGAVRSVLSTFAEPPPAGGMPAWKRSRASGGGVLLDLASHHIDLMRWFLDDEVDETHAVVASVQTEHDQAWLRLRMRGGVEVQSYFSFAAGPADFVEFIGERGTLRVDRHRPTVSLRMPRRVGYGVRVAFPVPPLDVCRWWPVRLVRPSSEPSYALALAAFVDAIRGGKTDLASLDDGLRSLEVVLAAERSRCAS